MTRLQWLTVTMVAAVFVVLAMVPTESWAHFFTHPLLAERAGVEVRPQTVAGAQLLRIMSAAAALLWLAIGPLISRQCRPERTAQQAQPAHHKPSFEMKPATWHRWQYVLGAILFLGLIERTWRMLESFWFDELAALIDYAQYGPGAIMGTYFVSSNHVFNTLLNWATIKIAGGVTEPTLRLPAFIAGLAAIGAMAILAREVARWSGRHSNGIVSLAIAVAAASPIMVLESVEARGYSMVVFFAALSSTLLLKGWRRASTGALLGYSIITALGVWTHLVFVALPIGHAVVAAFYLTRPGVRWRGVAGLLAIALAAITSIALLAPLLPDLLRIRREFLALDGNEPTLISAEGLRVFLGLGGAWSWVALPGVALFAIGLVGAMRESDRRVPILVTLLGLPILIIGTSALGSWMYARFALFALPGALLAICLGALDVRQFAATHSHRHKWAIRAAILAGLTVIMAWYADLSGMPPKQPIRDGVAFVRDNSDERTVIASAGLPDNVVAYYGILAKRNVINAGAGGSQLDSLSPQPQWLIVIYPRSLTQEAQAAIARDWILAAEFDGWVDWNNGNVLVYRNKLVDMK